MSQPKIEAVLVKYPQFCGTRDGVPDAWDEIVAEVLEKLVLLGVEVTQYKEKWGPSAASLGAFEGLSQI